MAEHQVLYRLPGQQQQQQRGVKGPSSSQILAVATLFPVGGVLLTLSGLTLAATVVGLAAATPLFVIFSPVQVPAGGVIGLALVGFLASGAFGLTALSALSRIVDYLWGKASPEHVERAKRRAEEAAGFVGKRARAQAVQSRTQVGGGRA